MQALVHFAVGVTGALVVLLFVDLQSRVEFAALLASGVWAMVPDGWWMFREFGIEPVALAWRGVHQSAFANLFWFHRWIDLNETGRNNLEAGAAMALLLLVGAVYYLLNDWTVEFG